MSKPSAIISPEKAFRLFGINIILVGDPGIGKTPIIAGGERTLILDLDAGSQSAVGSGADIWQITTWADMDEAYEYMRHEGHREYKWVWMDSISIGQDTLLEDVMNDLIENRGKSHRKPWLIDQGEYGENFNRLKQWVAHMKAQPFNFGITAHPFQGEDPVTGDVKIWPWIQGRNMPQTIAGRMDVIGYLKLNKDNVLEMRTKETDDYYARDRFGALGAGMLNPSIPKIQAKIETKMRSVSPARTATTARPVAKKAAGTVKKAQRAGGK